MKGVLTVFAAAFLLVGCSAPTQAILDNGKSGQITAVVFDDKNFNGAMDAGEEGLEDQVILGQDLSCPPTNPERYTRNDTDASGSIVFTDLKPGRYCVAYGGKRASSTKLTMEVDLSSEQNLQVYFGVSRD